MNTPIQLFAGGVVSSSANETGVNAGTLAGGGTWAPKSAASMVVTIPVTTIKLSAGNETYSFKVQDSPDGTTWTDRSVNRAAADDANLIVDGGSGSISFFADIVNPANVRFVATLGGTSPSITIGAVTLAPAFLFWVKCKANAMGSGWLNLKPTDGRTELNEPIWTGPASQVISSRDLDLMNLLPGASAMVNQGDTLLVAVAKTT